MLPKNYSPGATRLKKTTKTIPCNPSKIYITWQRK